MSAKNFAWIDGGSDLELLYSDLCNSQQLSFQLMGGIHTAQLQFRGGQLALSENPFYKCIIYATWTIQLKLVHCLLAARSTVACADALTDLVELNFVK